MGKKILFLVPTLRRGGAETQLVTLINRLDHQTFGSHLACFDQDTHQRDKLRESVIFHHYPRRKRYDFASIRAIARLIDSESIDVVHCTLQIALIYGWLARLLARRKPALAVTVHTTYNASLRSELLAWLLYPVPMMAAQSVIFVCKAQRRHWEKKWPFLRRNSTVVYNGTDTTHFDRSVALPASTDFRRQHDLPADANVIAHIAGFRVEKGHRVLVETFARLRALNSDAFLVFAGDGILRKEIEQLVADKGLSEKARFIGSVSDVRPLLANAAVSVITSTAETFSVAMLESMAMEVPLVAMDVGGTGEAVIPGQTGWLVPAGDVDAMARALHAALSDRESRKQLAQAARQYVLQNFTEEKMAREMEQLFVSL